MTKLNRQKFESVLKGRLFVLPSYTMYGGSAGLYDYGPLCAILEENILAAWKKHFVEQDSLFFIKTPIITPYNVFLASGHVDRFTDFIVRDVETNEIFRADHHLKQWVEKKLLQGEDKKYRSILSEIDNLTGEDLEIFFDENEILSPNGNKLTPPAPINMMFETKIGPLNGEKAFLRPETAQGQFLNFKRLLDYNGGKLPFGSASIGTVFRNEISPRGGLLRVREFNLAEIEYYVDPENKKCAMFNSVKKMALPLLTKQAQKKEVPEIKTITLEEAVFCGIIKDETIGYFIARSFLFLKRIGMNMSRVRIRQHMENEMAHYSSDCWDLEIETSHGWTECIGCADRGTYDLDQHTKKSNVSFLAKKKIEPTTERKCILELDKRSIGKEFKKETSRIIENLLELPQEDLICLKESLEKDEKKKLILDKKVFEITSQMVSISVSDVILKEKEFLAQVIEPSFGIGRILYSLLEHSFWTREGSEERTVFSFVPEVAPKKVAIVSISSEEKQLAVVKRIKEDLRKKKIISETDYSSASIGKKYSRYDEMGVLYVITVDFDTEKDASATVRERDTMHQERIGLEEIADYIGLKLE
eukprot:GHVN01076973.1.p1 GENE.GHVN01076973.1~~GHVN01076973.1.p1  ORF type:complete len:589 (-),score=58.07 GHVN01076973.1:20-1786(-)